MTESDSNSILVVDDIEENCDLLELKLKRNGYQVSIANNGQEALDTLAEKHIDLLLLDITMPVMDGVDVLKRIKQDEKYSKIPIIMLTAAGEPKTVLKCLRLGAMGYVTKPSDMDEVLKTIANCLH